MIFLSKWIYYQFIILIYYNKRPNNNCNRFHDDEDVDNINGDQYTTQPYYNYQTTENYNNNYNTQRLQQQFLNTKTPQLYTFQPFSTTKSPYNFQNFGSQFTVTTKNPFSNNNYFFSTSSTTTQTPPTIPPFQSTINPYVGNYYFLKQQTTVNPYNFANFGNFAKTRNNPESIDEINNNHLKRSYVASSYFVDSSNVRNVTTTINQRRQLK